MSRELKNRAKRTNEPEAAKLMKIIQELNRLLDHPTTQIGPEMISAKAPTRVLLVDDNSFVRRGVRGILKTVPELEIVFEAANGSDTLRAVNSMKPELVVCRSETVA